MRSLAQRAGVARLARAGLGDAQIAARTGVPRRTVHRWRTRAPGRTLAPTPWRLTDPAKYSYVLGLYLGDGYVADSEGSPFLQIFLDGRYPGIVQEAVAALKPLAPGQSVITYPRKASLCIVVQCSWARWPEAFPQHGTGRKHERRIALVDWQREAVDAFPHEFLRGLIHSDGCRCMNRFSTNLPSGRTAQYEYPRYFFSNLSEDIRALFCEYCDKLGIAWSQPNARNISVSHRRSVAALDAFVGPKR